MAVTAQNAVGDGMSPVPDAIGVSEEAGTDFGDRPFRPDVEGLRAVSVLLVVLYHANLLRITGGYVGVDVFFVISGFVITGVLTRERVVHGRTSLATFYARRARRILPAASFVLLGTVFAAYIVLGVVPGNDVASDGRWAAVFLANFHFESTGINYLTATQPPSPLQNYWSLSVEEQFYLVFPTIFAWVAARRRVLGLRQRLAVALGLIIVLSFTYSVVETATAPNAAYFSPLTRAWELAIGCLVAVSTPVLKRVPLQVARIVTWAGLLIIVVSAFAFGVHTSYLGAWVAIPVVGACFVIGGGVGARASGAEILLGRRVFLWIGRRSYSWYLVHFPVFVIAAESSQHLRLSTSESILLLVASLGIASVLYSLLENPIRHLQLPTRWTISGGIVVVVITVVVLTAVIALNTAPVHAGQAVKPATSTTEVRGAVAAASRIEQLPPNVQPSLSRAEQDSGWAAYARSNCVSADQATRGQICVLGDRSSTRLMVALGDSHVLMWLPVLEDIAMRAQMRLVVLSHWYCPSVVATITNPPGYGAPGQPYVACDEWRTWAVGWVKQHHPGLILVSNEDLYRMPAQNNHPPALFSHSQWQQGIIKLFHDLDVAGMRKILLGNIPDLGQSAPICLSNHTTDVQACSSSVQDAAAGSVNAEKAAAASAGVQYVNMTPWFCSQVCSAVIGRYIVYFNQFHITATYGRYLENVLAQAIGVPTTTEGAR